MPVQQKEGSTLNKLIKLPKCPKTAKVGWKTHFRISNMSVSSLKFPNSQSTFLNAKMNSKNKKQGKYEFKIHSKNQKWKAEPSFWSDQQRGDEISSRNKKEYKVKSNSVHEVDINTQKEFSIINKFLIEPQSQEISEKTPWEIDIPSVEGDKNSQIVSASYEVYMGWKGGKTNQDNQTLPKNPSINEWMKVEESKKIPNSTIPTVTLSKVYTPYLNVDKVKHSKEVIDMTALNIYKSEAKSIVTEPFHKWEGILKSPQSINVSNSDNISKLSENMLTRSFSDRHHPKFMAKESFWRGGVAKSQSATKNKR